MSVFCLYLFLLFCFVFSLILTPFHENCICVTRKGKGVVRQKGIEGSSTYMGDLSVYLTGIMVVKTKSKWHWRRQRERSLEPGLCSGLGIPEEWNMQCTAWGRTNFLSGKDNWVLCEVCKTSQLLCPLQGVAVACFSLVSQGSGGCSNLDRRLWKRSEDLSRLLQKLTFFSVCKLVIRQELQPETHVLVFPRALGQQWASPKIVC